MSDGTVNNIIQQLNNKNTKYSKILYLFKYTMTGKFIGIFWIMFLIQFIIYPIFIGPIIINDTISNLWSSIFTLSFGSEFYIWTYIISMFSHGGLFHIILNSIVLFSFGIIIEQEFGKKKFVKLFILFGLIANISQIIIINIAYQINIIPIYGTVDEFIMLGASGAISGFIGIISIKSPEALIKIIIFPFFKFKLIYATIIFIIGSLSIVVYYGFGAFNIAHIAHISGLISGIIYGIKIYGVHSIQYEFFLVYYKYIS